MAYEFTASIAAIALAAAGAPAMAAEGPNDAQIAHIAYTQGKCVRFVTPNNAGVWKFRRLQDTAGPVNLNRAKVVEERK